MKKIMFNDKFLLTQAMLDGTTKTIYRQKSDGGNRKLTKRLFSILAAYTKMNARSKNIRNNKIMKVSICIVFIVFCLLYAGGVKISFSPFSFSPFSFHIEKPFAVASIVFFILAIACARYDAYEEGRKDFQKELKQKLEELK